MMKRLLVVIALVSVLQVQDLRAQTEKKRLSVELIHQPGLLVAPGIFSLAWRPGKDQISYIRREGSGKTATSSLWLYDVESAKARVLLGPAGQDEKLSFSSYQWSPKGDALLMQGDHDLWLVEPESRNRKRLTEDSDEEEVPTFSPAGDRIAFVKQHNLFSLDLKSGAVTKLTEDGSEDVFNGTLDWVYEEELALRATGGSYEWSPDGKKIAYLRLDDSPVPQYPLTDYLQTHAGLSRERFPQPGDSNPIPSLRVVSVGEEGQHSWALPVQAGKVEYLGPMLSWTPDSKAVCFLALNRPQNELTVHLWEPEGAGDQEIMTERDPYWINSLVPPHFLANGQQFLWLSERDGWYHLYLFDRKGELLKQLTRGDWEIERPTFVGTASMGIDEKGGWFYFPATEKEPRERQLYRVRLDGNGFEPLTREPGTHSLDLSPNGRYLIDRFSAMDHPPEIRLLRADGSLLTTLEKPVDHLAEYVLAKTEFLEVKASDGATLYAKLVKPADFDPQKKYPVIVDVYGGPQVQVVQNRWGVTGLLDHLLAQEGFLIWSLDNRGSAARGHAWESAIFKYMGQRELADQLAGVSYLKSLPYVDPARIGIWGWSYGGYMTLYALTHAPGVFKCGVAGGPVTDWKFYDSIYTERYMRTPKENPDGYKSVSPLEAADQLKGSVLIIHGADDDNVHMQNTMNFIGALVKSQKPFELYIQPGEKHGFASPAARLYLDERLLEFFKRQLTP